MKAGTANKNEYERRYSFDQFGNLVGKPNNVGGKLRRLKPVTGVKCVIGRGQIPPGIPINSERKNELAEIERFINECGVTELPPGSAKGVYTINKPLEYSKLCLIPFMKPVHWYVHKGQRVKLTKLGGVRQMASDGWVCPVCKGYWHKNIKECGLCKHKQGRKVTVKELKVFNDTLGHDCEKCGFTNLRPFAVNGEGAAVCHKACGHLLGTPYIPPPEKKAATVRELPAKPVKNVSNNTASGGAENTAETSNEGKENTMAKGTKKVTGKKGKVEMFNGKPVEWFKEKPARHAVFLVLTNGEAMLTDQEIFAIIEETHGKNGSVAAPSHIGWYRQMLNGEYESTKPPKYAEGVAVPPRYYINEKGKRTTEKPVKGTEAAKESGPTERPKKKTAAKNVAKKKAALDEALAAPETGKKKPSKKTAAKKPAAKKAATKKASAKKKAAKKK